MNYTNAKIYNGYGPTETTACCSITEITKETIFGNEIITIGKPLCNYKIYILDGFLKPVPIGITGEIYIAGASVGKGYLNREKLTNEMFVNCPFTSNYEMIKMYKTGDIGKWNDDGSIIYIGRKDSQIKIRGQRIELSEIENTIKEINSIDDAIVIVSIDDEKQEKFLVCYFIGKSHSINGETIKNYLKSKLPLYMIPQYFVKMDELPVTSNGKLNKKALPKPDIKNIIRENYEAPKSEIEKEICSIFSDTLNVSISFLKAL